MRETPRTINPVRIRTIDTGNGIRVPKTAVTTPKGNSIIPNFFSGSPPLSAIQMEVSKNCQEER